MPCVEHQQDARPALRRVNACSGPVSRHPIGVKLHRQPEPEPFPCGAQVDRVVRRVRKPADVGVGAVVSHKRHPPRPPARRTRTRPTISIAARTLTAPILSATLAAVRTRAPPSRRVSSRPARASNRRGPCSPATPQPTPAGRGDREVLRTAAGWRLHGRVELSTTCERSTGASSQPAGSKGRGPSARTRATHGTARMAGAEPHLDPRARKGGQTFKHQALGNGSRVI